jgi:hypothetical protein
MTEDSTTDVTLWPRSLERLQAAVLDAERRLKPAESADSKAPAVALCRASIDQAKQAAGGGRRWFPRRRASLAWDCLAQFDRQFIPLMSDDEVRVLWESLKTEADEKLNDHRKKAVKALVAITTGTPARETVAEVMRHIHITSQNTYHKIDRLIEQIRYAGLLLFILVVALLAIASSRWFRQMSETLDRSLVTGTLLGLTGGVLSLAFTVARTNTRAKIPVMQESIQVAHMRPLIGAAVALPVILILEAEVVTVPQISKTWLIPIACFLAGFSERWFLGLVTGAERGIRAKGADDDKS